MSGDPDCVKLLGEYRRGESFDLGNHRFVDFLSHGTVLEDCTLTIRGSSRAVVFHGAVLRRCVVHAKRRFVNFSWHDVVLEDCVFKGRFVGCDFGPRPDAYPDHPVGEVSRCDYSQARLHLCRFFRSEMARVALPEWPYFTVLEPERNAADWLSIPFPESYRQVEQPLVSESVPDYRVGGVVAACQDAGEITKKHAVSIDRIHELIGDRPYIVF